LVLSKDKVTFDPLTEQRVHRNKESRVLVAHRHQLAPDNDDRPKLLQELAYDGIARTLIGFELASGKLPLAPKRSNGATLGSEDPTLFNDDRCGHLNGFHH
jgi:hypothetical protein